jgi:nitrite reductase (NADH) large subunit
MSADGAWFNDMKKKRTDISEMRETLIFGRATREGPAGPYGGRCSLAG